MTTCDGEIAKKACFNAGEVKDFCRAITDRAHGLGGLFVMASFNDGQLPDIRHIRNDDHAVVNMTAIAEEWTLRGKHVYLAPALFRGDLPEGKKGFEADVTWVLGLMADFDDEHASEYLARMPVEPSTVVETSRKRFQCAILFERAILPSVAKPLAVALARVTGCDHTSADISHVYRVPGTMNYPSAKKIAEGRSRTPQVARLVFCLEDWERVTPDNLRAAIDAKMADAFAGVQSAASVKLWAGAKLPLSAEEEHEQFYPNRKVDDRSSLAYGIIRRYFERGYEAGEIVEAFESNSDSPAAQHYTSQLQLCADIRRIGAKYSKTVESTNTLAWPAKESLSADGDGFGRLEIGSDVEVAQEVLSGLRLIYGEVIYCDGHFYRYDDTHWSEMSDTDLRREVHKSDGRSYGKTGKVRLTKQKINSIVNEMGVKCADEEFFDTPRVGMNCQSGFVTFDECGTATILPHYPDHRARHVIPYDWNPNRDWKQANLLGKLLNGCFEGDQDKEDKIALISELAGAAAFGMATKLRQPKAAIFYGAGANNGKSQIVECVRKLLPQCAVSAIPPSKFDDDPMVVQLIGKLLNATDELGSTKAIASDTFKQLITGEPRSTRDLYRSAVIFHPKALHIFATNVLPPFSGGGGFDHGVQRRLLVVGFNRVIPESERIVDLAARIAAEEGDALLSFAIEGAGRLVRSGRFTEPASSKLQLREWVHNADPVLAWMGERVQFDPDHRTSKKAAYADFRSWATGEGFDNMHLPGIANFVQRVVAKDGRIRQVRNNSEGRCFVGLRLSAVHEVYLDPTQRVDQS